ncbi:MAG: hypothetical protein A2X67_01345 [Ignavibacteria bacterium GWA2_55_11]|nr:MAG: hypothetical protein A2X67_01345 [Ignavibacteria bacterium GWA2_55_11]OGU44663.1 MAG: hypothetical protein A2X68_08395 [Ignavibacteria bacterium GWC2_56_12]OGU72193.1 MAG: hypothetical protein A3H45_04905 [Ignavibacteria bacterium RIFCSPLOWO2_02_FULL_55_14]HAV22143.1 hypothetical protein [Bacteroidota bacterium]
MSAYTWMRSRIGAVVFASRMLMRGERPRNIVEWFRSLRPNYLLERPSPWITFGAIDFLEEYIRPGMNVFEYGSGGSTFYWLRYKTSLISVEHDPMWYEIVHKKLAPDNSVEYRLSPPMRRSESDKNSDPSDPAAYASEAVEFTGYTFEEYVRQIDTVTDGSLDIVLVDGRSRPSCIVHAAPKVRRGGILILDNAERPYYVSRIGSHLENFRPHQFSGMTPCNRWISQTNIYLRES